VIEFWSRGGQSWVMSIDEKIACGINVAFGAALGFAIYFLALGGYSFLLMSRPGHWWNGWGAFFICVGGGAVAGFHTYQNRLKNLDPTSSSGGMYSGEAGISLLWRRLAVIAGAIVALYFIWKLAKGI
jgi:hypothetical protein